MSLLTKDYFIGEYVIQNIEGTNPVAESRLELLNAIISRREPEILKHVLGETLYTNLIAGLAEIPIPAKWTNLKNQIINTTAKTSVYTGIMLYYWKNAEMQRNTATGQTETITPVVNPFQIADLYNADTVLIGYLQNWIRTNIATYPEFDGKSVAKLNGLF